jgi:hypothetical protein
MERDWDLVERLSRLEDCVVVGVVETAAYTGLAPATLRGRGVKGFPTPIPGLRHLKWSLGQLRAWAKGSDAKSQVEVNVSPARSARQSHKDRPPVGGARAKGESL